MRAVQITRFGGPDVLEVRENPEPEVGPGEVLIRLAASTVNPVDIKIRSGVEIPAHLPLPLTLGWDLAGAVVACGPGASRFEPHDTVIAMSAMGATGRGAWAEYVALPDELVARAPGNISLVEAAGLPLAGLAAAKAVDVLAPVTGQQVLVIGAAGAVGSLAVQLLQLRGVDVHALVHSAEQVDWAREIGAQRVHVGRVPDRSVDGGLDTAGAALPGAIRPGGRYVSIVPGTLPTGAASGGLETAMSFVDESGRRLAQLVELVEGGRLRLRTATAYELADVAEAHRRCERGGLAGKVALLAS